MNTRVNIALGSTPNANLKLWIVDCLSGKRGIVDDGPFTIGGSPSCDLIIGDSDGNSVLARIIKTNGVHHVLPGDPSAKIILDGQKVQTAELSGLSEHTLVIQGHPFAISLAGEEGRAWYSAIDHNQWHVFQCREQKWTGPVSATEIPKLVSPIPGDSIVICTGMKAMGFYPHQILPRMGYASTLQAQSNPVFAADAPEVNSEYGEFTCPVCWFKFDRGDSMNIAVHATLRGDSVLGEEHMQRFLASRFNDRGQALDAMGMVAPEIACPHCRRKLPPNFLDQPHYIFSIVGAPSSGKSYYLSVLIKKMQDVSFKDFGVTFRDASPSENVILNSMRNHLFSASTPEEAFVAKTSLEGALYETLPRQGSMVKLPKPFIFRMTDRHRSEEGFSIVFYDNAGEHFEPGRNSAESPGAQHIAVASGIFFLFDPLSNPEFRRKLTGQSDPQLNDHKALHIDQQDILLAESETRIKEILGLSASERISTPLSVIVGKSDAWLHLLGEQPMLPAIADGDNGPRIRPDHLRANSERVRKLLLEVCPSIVANAESISSDVHYFAASPLGHAPVPFTDSHGVNKIGPDPTRLDPQRVEDATLWVLSKIAPSMFPLES